MALAIIVVLAVADVALYLTRPSAASSKQREAAAKARASAIQLVPQILTFGYKTVGVDVTRAVGDLTGTFRTTYAKVLQTEVAPSVTKGKLTIRAADLSVAVIGGQTDRVSLLVFVTVSATGGSITQTLGSARLVTMAKAAGDRWLVAGMSVL